MNRTIRLLGAAVAGLATPALAAAITLSGVVRNEAGTGLGNVDVDCIDLCSGDNIFLSGDHTAADGSFSIVVPGGTYDIHFVPPAGSTVAAGDLQSVAVTANLNLGTVTLHPGRLVSGVVQTPAGAAVAGVDLKFVNAATDHRVFLTKDVTTAAGAYSVRVPPGTWNLDFRPPASSIYADGERLGLVVGASDVSGLVDRLLNGFAISGTIRDKHNNKIKNVDIDAFDVCSGRRINTAHDNTDVNGNYSIVVPPGTYTFNYDPPRCKALESVRTVNWLADRSRSLGTEQLKDAVLVSGTVLDHNGAALAEAKVKFYDVTTAGAPRQSATDDRTDASGAFSIYVPPGTYDMNIEPPAGHTDLVGHLNSVVVGGATFVGTVQLVAGVAVTGSVTGPGGVPVEHVNINAVESTTRVAQRLSQDATDATGHFTVSFAPGTYDLEFDPPACSGLAPTAMANVTIGGPGTLPAQPLVTGVHLLGSVLDPGALPVANVDLDVYPAGGTTKLYTPNDKTAADGTYDVLIPPGTYDVRYVPSSLTRFRPAQIASQPVPVNTTVPTISLANGWLLSGFVRGQDTFLPLLGATVDVYTPGGLTPLWTPHHVTDVLGAYTFAVDAGTWDLRFVPPAASPYGPLWSTGVTVGADLALPDALLPLSSAGAGDFVPGERLALSAPQPNPARGPVRFVVSPRGGEAELSAWDLAGRRVATLWKGRAAAPVTVTWDGRGAGGEALPSGLYFVRLHDGRGEAATRRVTLVH